MKDTKLNKFTLAIAATVLIAGCQQAPQHRKSKMHFSDEQVYHFSDGRVGYRADDMTWYYLIQTQTQSPSSTSTGISGGWVKGNPPSEAEIAEADVEMDSIIVDEAGEPATEAEATAVGETVEANPSGEISGSIEISADATGEIGAVVGSTDSGSFDAGSSDTGGFDAGGGDAGGGGGGE